jgi:hypothetical protein
MTVFYIRVLSSFRPRKNLEIISNSAQKFSVGNQKILNLIFLFIFYEIATRNVPIVTQYIEEFIYY